MKDNISLIAAATGGFMLSIAISGIVRAAPVTFLEAQPSFSSTQSQLQIKPDRTINQKPQNDRTQQQEFAAQQPDGMGNVAKLAIDQIAASYQLSRYEYEKLWHDFAD